MQVKHVPLLSPIPLAVNKQISTNHNRPLKTMAFRIFAVLKPDDEVTLDDRKHMSSSRKEAPNVNNDNSCRDVKGCHWSDLPLNQFWLSFYEDSMFSFLLRFLC